MPQLTPISCTQGLLKLPLVVFAMALTVYIVGPPLYWKFREGLTLVRNVVAFCACAYSALELSYILLFFPDILTNT